MARPATAMTAILVTDCDTVNQSGPGANAVSRLPIGSRATATSSGLRRPRRSAITANPKPKREAARVMAKMSDMEPSVRPRSRLANGSVWLS